LGPEPEILRGHETIDRFLDVMAWDCDASRTNAVAAAVTIMLRRNWPGAKPLVLVTASKSHAGKDTTIDFAVGEEIASGGMTYQRTDWAVEQAVAGLLKRKPETAVMHFNNARLGIREQHIQSGFLERFITDAAPTIHSTKQAEPIRLRSNDKVVCISTNFGCVSEDLMNRSLPIHLTPDGDVQARRTPIGNPKLDYLPTHRARIAAELRGMIETWKEAGMPLDDAVEHPMTSWAKTVGGILRVSGYADFLENFRQRKTSDDPLRTGLAILGAHENGIWVTATDLVRRVCDLGLTKRIVPEGDRENEAAMARGLGIVLTAHVDETFEFIDPNSGRRLTLCLRKTPNPHRWTQYDKEHGRPPESSASREPHHRYRFDVE
jgi:hypothetical protein